MTITSLLYTASLFALRTKQRTDADYTDLLQWNHALYVALGCPCTPLTAPWCQKDKP